MSADGSFESWSWLVHDVPASVGSLEENAAARGRLPARSRETWTGSGTTYAGPCPAAGAAPGLLIIEVAALDASGAGLPAGTPAGFVGASARGKVIADGRLILKLPPTSHPARRQGRGGAAARGGGPPRERVPGHDAQGS